MFALLNIRKLLHSLARSERGVTITELLVGITLFGVVGGSLAGSMTAMRFARLGVKLDSHLRVRVQPWR